MDGEGDGSGAVLAGRFIEDMRQVVGHRFF
jgi:hypothetical protein